MTTTHTFTGIRDANELRAVLESANVPEDIIREVLAEAVFRFQE
jgi:hypothetical protein